MALDRSARNGAAPFSTPIITSFSPFMSWVIWAPISATRSAICWREKRTIKALISHGSHAHSIARIGAPRVCANPARFLRLSGSDAPAEASSLEVFRSSPLRTGRFFLRDLHFLWPFLSSSEDRKLVSLKGMI